MKSILSATIALVAVFVVSGCGKENIPVADAPGDRKPPPGSFAAKGLEHFRQAHSGAGDHSAGAK